MAIVTTESVLGVDLVRRTAGRLPAQTDRGQTRLAAGREKKQGARGAKKGARRRAGGLIYESRGGVRSTLLLSRSAELAFACLGLKAQITARLEKFDRGSLASVVWTLLV